MDTGSDRLPEKRTQIWDLLRLALDWECAALEGPNGNRPLLMTDSDQQQPKSLPSRQSRKAPELLIGYAIVLQDTPACVRLLQLGADVAKKPDALAASPVVIAQLMGTLGK